MIIELYGLPGSGKTTLAKKLASSDDKFMIINFINRWERYYFFILFIINHPILFFRWLSFLIKNKKLFFYKIHLLSVAMAKTQKVLMQKNLGKHYIIDEGLVQRVLSVSDTVISGKLLGKLLTYLNHIDRFVCVDGGDFYRFTKDSQKLDSPRIKLGEEYFNNWKKLLRENKLSLNDFLFCNKEFTSKGFMYKYDVKKIEDFIIEILV